MTSVCSITIQRRAVSTPLPETSSTIVIKMLHQVLEHSRKAFKSGAETYAKIICLCGETQQGALAVTERTTADTVHSSVVRAADCRSAGPWFNSRRDIMVHLHDVVKQSDHSDDQHHEPNQNDYKKVS